jgi:hypothetical protein
MNTVVAAADPVEPYKYMRQESQSNAVSTHLQVMCESK